MPKGLGPAIPIGFGGVMDWLLENGYMKHPEEMLEEIEEDRRRQQVNGGGGGGGFGGGGTAATRAQAIASMNTSVDNMIRALRGDFAPVKRKKKKKKVSRYHRCVGKHLKALKKKHPRTPHTKLMKRAHAACKKQRKREGW